MNDSNLININSRPLDEQREIQRKGGIANGELRRRRKTQREYLQNALDMKVKTIPQLKKLAEKMGLDIDKATLQELLTIKLLLNTANKSDVSSLKDIVSVLGEQDETSENNGILDALADYLKGAKKDVE